MALFTLNTLSRARSSSDKSTSADEEATVPKPDPETKKDLRRSIFPKGKHFVGWKFGGSVCAATSFIVLAINVGVTAWVLRQPPSKNGGDQELKKGTCSEIWQISAALNLLVNALSTLMLGASNYSMQCLCAPKRREISRAHQKRQWLDIGVPSIRNLRFISRKRAFLWILMGLTSLPFHLLYDTPDMLR